MRPSHRLLPLCIAAGLCAGHAGQALAQDAEAPPTWLGCSAADAIPAFRPLPPAPAPGAEVETAITGDRLDAKEAATSRLSGGVELTRGQQWLATRELTFDHATGRYVADGDVRYQDPRMRFTAVRAEGHPDDGEHTLFDLRYQLVERRGNGSAGEAWMRGEEGVLRDATYTTCEPVDPDWTLRASRIDLDQEAGLGSARNAVLRVGSVPVLYVPYMTFPIDDRRRSGFLYPGLGWSSNTGIDFQLPYYLNLAPNYDATITARVLGKRGVMVGGEFRYLTERSRGVVDGAWLENDSVDGLDRGYFALSDTTRLSRNWYTRVSIYRVSDDRYFEDFGDGQDGTSVSLLESSAGVFGRGLGWTASLTAQDFQITDPLLPADAEPFRRLPRARFDIERSLGPVDLGLRSEAVAFDHDVRAGGQRLDLKPFIALPLEGAAWFLRPQLAWRWTGYALDRDLADSLGGDDAPSRSVPITSVDAGLFFERDVTWKGRDLVQTLEPRLFLLDVPYRAQDDLPVFDTQPLTFTWSQLFRDNVYTGPDRQADARQATLALGSRVFSQATGEELLSLGLGRIHYFDPPRVALPGEAARSDDGSPWVGEVTLRVDDRWSVGVTQQWNEETSRTDLSSARVQYRFHDTGVVNLAYRYRADQLEQSDVSFVYPVNDAWRVVGRMNYSLRDDQTLEALGGVEWSDCCIAVRALVRRYVRNVEGESDNALYLEIELKGLGSAGRDMAPVLQRAILGYTR